MCKWNKRVSLDANKEAAMIGFLNEYLYCPFIS